jgi:starch synthase (maltosyl-transferring)
VTRPDSDDRAAPDGRHRVVISGVMPEIDGGRCAIKRSAGETVAVEADVFADGHDVLACVLRYREAGGEWHEVTMAPLGNDRWRGTFPVTTVGRHEYTVQAWIDHFSSWARDLAKRVAAQQDVRQDLLIGAALIDDARRRAAGPDARHLEEFATALREERPESEEPQIPAPILELMHRYADRRFATTYRPALPVVVDRERARFSAWYEMFPRSCAPAPGRHGTLADCMQRLPYVAAMGFDVLYLPPIHPIGRSHRKGKNNAVTAAPGDPGSPWAIGADTGGHTAVHPELGTLDDVDRLVELARRYGIEVALDLAFQCSADHPYVQEHPEWFRRRPDGTVQFAENPPKKYEDIYPFDFETDAWRELWAELRRVVEFWIDRGIRIFRVDNPHTKPFPFWEWLIGGIKSDYPDVLFLAEAFTRPKVMYRLSQLGFSQSYTYFAWRNTRAELTEYFTELTQTPAREHFRPHLWTNTPDILTEYLQLGGRPAFMARLVLAATLGAGYGIYGPAFELCENRPREAGSEEYLDSEKYEIKHWDLDRPDSLKDFVAAVNRIRRENPALHGDWSLRFHAVDNDQLICYSKRTEDLASVVLVVVNLDPHHTQSGWTALDLETLGLDREQPYQVHDLLTGAKYLWHGARNYVELDPQRTPAHIFRLRRRVRTEHQFEYYM